MSETKVAELFRKQQFKINGYKMFLKGRYKFGRGIMFYVNEQSSIFGIHSYGY